MPGVKMFAVVHFTEDDSVDVVRSTWLIKVVDDNGYTNTETRWPQQNMAKHVKNGSQPTANWTYHPVRVMTTSDDYLHARKKADEAQFTSNLSSEEQLGEGPNSRKRKPVASWSSPSSDEGTGTSPPHKKAPKVRTPYAATGEDLQDLPRAVPPTKNIKRTVPEIDEVLERKILKELVTIRMELAEIKKNQEMLSNMVYITQQDSQPVALPQFDNLPVKTMEDFSNLERKCANETFAGNLIQSLSAIGGNDIVQFTKRMMRRMLCDKVGKLFNWKGKNTMKSPFSGTKICSIIMKAVKANRGTANASDHEVEDIIKTWLRFAAERDGGRQKRIDQKKRETEPAASTSTSTSP